MGTWDLKAVKGDITKLTGTDAIVNAANASLLGGGGVDGAIHRAAGPELLKECRTLNGCPVGEAKLTKAYRLPCRYVIHTVGPIVQPFLTEEHKKQLASCYTSCLNVASEYHLDSIAFCCISTGVFMFPQDKACEIAVKTVRDWLDQHPDSSVQKVVFNVYKDEDYRLYDARLNKKIHIR